MDTLSDLPVVKEEQSPQEKAIMSKYFGVDTSSPSSSQSGPGWGTSLKIVGMATLVYLLVSNPFTEKLLRHIPYTDSPAGSVGIKVLLFFIVFLLISRFV